MRIIAYALTLTQIWLRIYRPTYSNPHLHELLILYNAKIKVKFVNENLLLTSLINIHTTFYL